MNSPTMVYSEYMAMFIPKYEFYEDDLGGTIAMWSESMAMYRVLINYSFN